MSAEPAAPEFLRAFAAHAGASGELTFEAFMRLALYDPAVGYYRRTNQRVGYAPGTDFFTASTSGPVFGELVAAACVDLLGDRDPGAHTFVEIGAEPGGGVLAGVTHPFAGLRTLRVGDPLQIAGPAIVFSNELFDAQPFRRFRFRDSRWRELGVRCREGRLEEAELTGAIRPGAEILPAVAPEGYVIDAPLAAADLAGDIARQPWTGLFIAFDYGKTWRELIEATPAGTARAYRRHTQSNDLLAHPGGQDLTCHICWDWLVDTLRRQHFEVADFESQEAFFLRHAGRYIAPAIADDAARFTRRKQSLLQLIHGSHLGQKFQVLHGLR